ncbi:EAL domain-containing protein [Synechococcus sp. FGCU-3]|nr:EAL domain-containing protein [Synechococcus sp. FGCU3]
MTVAIQPIRGTEQLLQLLNHHALPAQHLCLEITEQVALRNPVQAERTMERLRCLGVSFAMDAFHAGMTSLGYLRDLPLNYVKIDKSFIRLCQLETSSRMMVEFIVQLGRELGLRTMAEGVEPWEMLQCVRDLGISMTQGHLTTRPMPFSPPSAGWLFAGNGAAALAQVEA